MNDNTPLIRKLERDGLRVQRSFVWQMDETLGCTCLHHNTAKCNCQMAIYLVYGSEARPATLLVHSGEGRTRVRLDQSVGQRVSADFQSQIMTALQAA